MLHMTMIFRIFENTNSTLVVHLQSESLMNTISKLRQNVPHSCNLLPSLNSSYLLCLSSRKCNNCLQLAVPYNCSTSHHCHKASRIIQSQHNCYGKHQCR